MKEYCTQNDSDCETCSLVNYGRDCRDVPIEPKERLTKQEFQSEMLRVDTLRTTIETARAEYWVGYIRGLERQYCPEIGGPVEEHAVWLGIVDGPGIWCLRARQGYRDGLFFKPSREVNII